MNSWKKKNEVLFTLTGDKKLLQLLSNFLKGLEFLVSENFVSFNFDLYKMFPDFPSHEINSRL